MKKSRKSTAASPESGTAEQRVLELRKSGHSNKEIAEITGFSYRKVGNIAHKLIQEKRIKPLCRHLTGEERVEREEQIVKLRQDGYSNEEIAEKLNLSVWVIVKIVSKLIQESKVNTRPRRSLSRATWRDLESDRVKIIITMVKQRATLQKIGDELGGLTRERVRQLIKNITAEHGKEVFEPDTRVYTTTEIAEGLGVDVHLISAICAKGEIACRKKGIKDNGLWIIEESELERLLDHPLISREKKCVICKQPFTLGKRPGRKKTCSEECFRAHNRQIRNNYANQKPTLDSLEGWRKDLWQRLQSHHIPKREEWLTMSEAARRAGLSDMQLEWLRHRNIVTIRPDPVKTWRGQPMATYAASEMEIARQVFEVYAKKNGKHH